MCREDALEYSDYFPHGIIRVLPGTDAADSVRHLVRRMTLAEYRRQMAMTPGERFDLAFNLSLAERARRLAPPL